MLELIDLPLGKRYPFATRKLSDDDIKRLDFLYAVLNRSARTDAHWNVTENAINKLLYGK